MGVSNLSFTRSSGGLGRPLPQKDHVSGLVAWLSDAEVTALGGALTTSAREQSVRNITEAEALGFAEGSAVTGVIWYHINWFFKMNPKGKLWIGIYDELSIDYDEIETLQAAAEGEIRQIGVFDTSTFATGSLTTLQTSVSNLRTLKQPVSVLYAGDISAVSPLSGLSDLRALSANGVTACIGQDGAGAGAALFTAQGYSITDLGLQLGLLSLANVHESTGWVAKFNVLKDTEWDTPAFANGDLVKDIASATVDGIFDKGYAFLIKRNLPGVYSTGLPTAVTSSDDFAYQENNRIVDKALRGVDAKLTPFIDAPLYTDPATGYISQATIDLIKKTGEEHLVDMVADGELSGGEVLIDPEQNVVSTGKLEIAVNVVSVGVARDIDVTIGQVLTLTGI